jgi:hypothetical protein
MGRMIRAEMWEDDFFAFMPVFDKLLWIGLITVCADDQGRLQDHPAMIRSKAFPVDDIELNKISETVNRFVDSGKVVRYIVDGHKCLQIVNWWKHQKPQWAGRSNYPAPDGWVDRERYHTTGNEIVTTNWKSDGGYIANYIACKLPSDIKVNGDTDTNIDIDINQKKDDDMDDDLTMVINAYRQYSPCPTRNDIQMMENRLKTMPADVIIKTIQSCGNYLNSRSEPMRSFKYVDAALSKLNKDGTPTQYVLERKEETKYLDSVTSEEVVMEGKFKETLSGEALGIINQLEIMGGDARTKYIDWRQDGTTLKAIVNSKENIQAYNLAMNMQISIGRYLEACKTIDSYEVVDEG